MRMLFVGDVVAQAGRRVLKDGLRAIRNSHSPDLIVVNGENSARGHGLTPQCSDQIFRAGADVITSGNHIWDRREVLGLLDRDPRVLRPANYPDPAPGSGVHIVEHPAAGPVAVVNLMGRLFMADIDDPFRAVDDILDELEGHARLVLIDFHAEATSEKIAFGWHVDGRVTAVVGTHTHVATADERVLPGGTAYITDVGMTGPYDSVIGVDKTAVLERFRTQRPVRFTPAEDDVRLCGVLIDADPESGRAISIERVDWRPPEGR
jgi:metallophosphoesterase (TIGR00282 family)